MTLHMLIETMAAEMFEVFQLSQGHYPGAFSGKPNTGPTWSQLSADPAPDAVRLAGSWRAVACSVVGRGLDAKPESTESELAQKWKACLANLPEPDRLPGEEFFAEYDPERTGEITGAFDHATGEYIREGDLVIAYPARYPEKTREDGVVELDVTQAPTAPDTPQFAGCVVWDEDELAWEVETCWVRPDWEPRPSRIRLGGPSYVFITGTADQMPGNA